MNGKICFVVQRYGLEVNGGAELLCRQYAERLSTFYDLEVLTTKAVDYKSWRNEYKADCEILNGIVVRRFDTAKERSSIFTKIHEDFLAGKMKSEAEQEWLEAQGPYCPSLIQYLRKHQEEYKVIIFFTYLYYTTVAGINSIYQKSIVIPFAHDEPPIKMHIFDSVFKNPNGIVYSTQEEQNFIQNKYHNGDIPWTFGGSGVDLPESLDGGRFRSKHGLSDYIVYVGRIEEAKGSTELFKYFHEYKKRNAGNLKLVLMGKPLVPVPVTSDIISLGFVSDEDKFDGIAGARALVLPSKFESLSIVVLEAMAVGTPVIVNGACGVLKGHCLKSNGAFYYTNYFDFEGEVAFLLNSKNNETVSQMIANAKSYVNENYQWNAIVSRLRNLIEEVASKKGDEL